VTIPATSFIVTCCNLGAFLDEVLDSLFAQTVQDFEVVVVNDGSTDGLTCHLLANLDRPRTRVVHSERRGLPGARNFGVGHARGRFLCMVDADDLLEPSYLERSLQVLESRPDVAFASHWLRAFGDEAWDWMPTDCGFPALLHANTVNGAALLRREVFDRVGGFDESMVEGCEDWEFWIRVVGSGFQGVILPEFLFRYRRRLDSMSRTMHAIPGMPALYRQLVERHPDTFKAHLLELLWKRDEGIAFLSRNDWLLSTEWMAELQGERQWFLDNDKEKSTRLAADHALRLHEDQVHRLHAALSREAGLNQALRASWSWRLTSPLRALVGWVRR
jgi:glycosyltransferase involved in cell wall biosynthesis